MKLISKTQDQKGVVLMAVLVMLTVLALVAGYVMSLAHNQHRLLNALTKSRVDNYYKARAGMVDAQWRIRTNSVLPGWASDFTNPAFNPPIYFLDLDILDGNNASTNRAAGSDVRIDIGAVNASGLREIRSTGLE